METRASGERHLLAKCSFHDDKVPSALVDLDTQQFKCKACDARGDVFKLLSGHFPGRSLNSIIELAESEGLLEARDVVSPNLVDLWHAKLMADPKMLQWITEKKGLSEDVLRQYKVGLDRKRITFPVKGPAGNVVNVRLYSPIDKTRKVINHVKHFKGEFFFPHCNKFAETVLLTEGEAKALLLESLGYFSVSSTGGAKSWPYDCEQEFNGRNVVIVYDIDRSGRRGAKQAARRLYTIAKSVRIVQLDLDEEEYPTGDVTDYFVTEGRTKEDLDKLIEDAPVYRPSGLETEELPEGSPEQAESMHLWRTSEAQYNGRFVKTNVTVSAKDTAPYIVPRRVKVTCDRSLKNVCSSCPVYASEDEEPEFEVPLNRSRSLTMLRVPSDKKRLHLKRIVGIPSKCKVHELKEIASANFEEIRLIPEYDPTDTTTIDVVRRAYFLGHGIETNTSYEMTARVVPDPQTQQATLLVTEAKPKVDNLSTFSLTDEEADELRSVFAPEDWTLGALSARLDDIYEDLECNVTRIYERRDLHLFVDLIMHSVLYMNFQNRVVKGWAEGLIVGDTGQGKTEVLKWLLEHYGVGRRTDAKGATIAGLIGGVQETSNRWFITWGLIPLEDKRFIGLEEIQGMAKEVIAKMTEVRSSGLVRITKIITAQTHARTRLLFVGNPRSNRKLNEFNYGIEALKELVGTAEDLRRFDIGMTVAAGEVPMSVVNAQNKRTARRTYTSDLCRRLILFAWSRSADQVKFQDDTVKSILRVATQQGGTYSSQIPLCEPADQRHKIARLSAALAARTASIEDDCIVVRPCHVEYVQQYMEKLYAKPSMGYAAYSKALHREKRLEREDEVRELIQKLPHPDDVVRILLESETFTLWDVMDWLEWEREETRAVTSQLLRDGAIGRSKTAYFKKPAFIDLLRRMSEEGVEANIPEHVKELTRETF